MNPNHIPRAPILIAAIFLAGCGGTGSTGLATGGTGGLARGSTDTTGAPAGTSNGTTQQPGGATEQDFTAFTFPLGKGGTLIQPTFPALEGTKFKVLGSHDVQVYELGSEDATQTQDSTTTDLYDADDNVLASVTFTNADPISDGYFWKPITPVVLHPGNTYYVGTFHGVGAGSTYLYDTRPATTPSFLVDLGTFFKTQIQGGTWQRGAGAGSYGTTPARHYNSNFKCLLVQ